MFKTVREITFANENPNDSIDISDPQVFNSKFRLNYMSNIGKPKSVINK
jgi:hypothetical protein